MALTDSLISYYKSDTDGSYPDAHGSNNGTINGATYTASGKINGAYSYDGAAGGDYIDLGFKPPANADWAYSMWIKPTDYAAIYGIVATQTGDASRQGLLVRVNSDNTIHVYWHDQPTDVGSITPATTYTAGQWVHIIINHDKTNNIIKLYTNGVLRGTDAGKIVQTHEHNIQIGRYYDGSSQKSMKGLIDEVGVWSRTLTDGGVSVGQTAGGEIAELYNSGAGLQYPFTTGVPLKRWNGSAWVETHTVKRYTGAAWTSATMKYYDGAAWQDIAN